MSTASDYLLLSQVDAILASQPIAVPPVTFVGVQSFAGIAMLLVNNAAGSTKALVCYDDECPVIISEVA